MCDRVVSEDPFLTIYCPDKYITQKVCGEAVDDFLATLKLIPDWFDTSKMIKELFTALYAHENITYFNEDSGNVLFSCIEVGILNIHLNNIKFDDNFDEYNADPIILIRLLACHIKLEKFKALKKS